MCYIIVQFEGPGHYWLVSPSGDTSLDLEWCYDRQDLKNSATKAMIACGLHINWYGWFVRKGEIE